MHEEDGEFDEPAQSTICGIAALTLLEAIVLSLQAKGVLTNDEVDEAFDAAISAHKNRHEALSAQENAQAAAILSKLRVEGNSVRLDL